MYKYSKLLVICFIFQSMIVNASELTLISAAPVVVETAPQAGLSSVDPLLNEIRVTFSKDMMANKMWSVVKVDNGLFPEIIGEVKFLKNKRTFVMPVKLMSNKTYALRFNSPTHNAFKDLSGKSAETYLLVFKTR